LSIGESTQQGEGVRDSPERWDDVVVERSGGAPVAESGTDEVLQQKKKEGR
jgi:hypothetical protein